MTKIDSHSSANMDPSTNIFFEKLDQVLNRGEMIYDLIDGSNGADLAILVATDLRIIFIKQHQKLNDTLEILPYDELEKIYISQNRNIAVITAIRSLQIATRNPMTSTKFVNNVNEFITHRRDMINSIAEANIF